MRRGDLPPAFNGRRRVLRSRNVVAASRRSRDRRVDNGNMPVKTNKEETCKSSTTKTEKMT